MNIESLECTPCPGKNGPPKQNAENAQYITQSNDTYTA